MNHILAICSSMARLAKLCYYHKLFCPLNIPGCSPTFHIEVASDKVADLEFKVEYLWNICGIWSTCSNY